MDFKNINTEYLLDALARWEEIKDYYYEQHILAETQYSNIKLEIALRKELS